MHEATTYLDFALYLHSIYAVLKIISDLELIYSECCTFLYEIWALTNFGIHRVGGGFKMTVLSLYGVLQVAAISYISFSFFFYFIYLFIYYYYYFIYFY